MKVYVVIVEIMVPNCPWDETHVLGVYSDVNKARNEIMRCIGNADWEERPAFRGVVQSVKVKDKEFSFYHIYERELDKQSFWKK